MAVNDKFSILVPLAKELGYKDAKEMRDALGKEEAGRGEKKGLGFGNIGGPGGVGTGFLGGREIGGGFGVGVKSRLAKGASVKEAISGGFKDFAQTFTAENIKRRALEKTFGGSGFISAFARGKLKKTYEEGSKSPTKEGISEKQVSSKGSDAYLGVLAKSSLAIPGMARDMNVMRQNIQRLVKLKAGPQEKGKKAYATAADFTKREKSQMSGKALSDAERERKKDTDYFAEQDKIEAEQEAARRKNAKSLAPTPEREQNSDGLLEQIFGIIKNGIIAVLAYIFTPKNLLKVIGKIFVIGTIIASLFSGITDAWKKWKESGSLYEALVAGIGGIVDFLTFGLFGEKEVKKLFDGISSFFEPLVENVKEIYYTVKDWVVNNVGIPRISLGTVTNPITKTVYELGAIGPYYPFKKNPKSEQPEYSSRESKKSKSETAAPGPSPTPLSPTPEAKENPKMGYTKSGEKLNFPGEVIFDSNTGKYSYKGISFDTPENQKELDTILKAINDKAVVEYQSVDASGQPTLKTFNGATGEVGTLPPKQSPTAVPSAPGSTPSGGGEMSAPAGGTGGSGVGGVGGEVSASPAPETNASPSTSGSELSDSSSQIAEAQRMESAADMGSSINASTTNNNSGTMGQTPSKIADVYDSEFAKLYSMA